jgi:two-component system invasion response regulator UvrY
VARKWSGQIHKMTPNSNLRILIVDDHAIVRAGLKQILAEEGDMAVEGEADTSSQALQLARQGAWDVVLLDISMPDRNGIETLQLLKKEHPKLKVLMLSMYRETQYAVRALKSGAAGYLNKQSAPAELVTAIRQVASGKKYISPEVAQELASEVSSEREGLPHEKLSNREFQTLCMIASGKTVSSIANTLSLSVKTVSMYRARLLEKMQLKNNAELTHYAIKHGLVE